jgi:serine/threonine protein kinase
MIYRYSPRSDIWAIGITMIFVITQKVAFSGKKEEEIKEELLSGKYPQIKIEDYERLYDKEMINLINSMLTV